MTLRAFGAFNGSLPVPTGMAIGFVKNPKSMAFNRYAQYVKAPDVNFLYYTLDIDEPNRLVELNDFAWAYDDYRPSGRGWNSRVQATADLINRWCMSYEIGDQTIASWKKSGLDPKMLYDKIRTSQMNLHRAQRVFTEMTGATYTLSYDINTLMGTTGAYFDKSSGVEYDPNSGAVNDNFQIIKRTFMRVSRLVHLQTNGVVTGEELLAVIPPIVAEKMATSGEMVNYLKQSPYAKELINPNFKRWGLPDEYEGVKIVVEDTPRVFINKKADGTIASVTTSTERDYIHNVDTIYFVSRVGGTDGGYGLPNFSTVQIYTHNGEVQVEAFSEPKHKLVESSIVMEDQTVVPTTLGALKLTDVLST